MVKGGGSVGKGGGREAVRVGLATALVITSFTMRGAASADVDVDSTEPSCSEGRNVMKEEFLLIAIATPGSWSVGVVCSMLGGDWSEGVA